jgi:hypothetical protein
LSDNQETIQPRRRSIDLGTSYLMTIEIDELLDEVNRKETPLRGELALQRQSSGKTQQHLFKSASGMNISPRKPLVR